MAAQPTFTGDIPKLYDAVIGPALFEELGDELAQRVATKRPRCVLETAAGTGIVTRRLRDRLPAGSEIIATDLSPAMLATAETKFSPGEVTLSPCGCNSSAVPRRQLRRFGLPVRNHVLPRPAPGLSGGLAGAGAWRSRLVQCVGLRRQQSIWAHWPGCLSCSFPGRPAAVL